jgi:hypothetical protein
LDGCPEFPFKVAEFDVPDVGSGDQHKVAGFRKNLLVQAKHLSEEPLGPIPFDRVTDSLGSDDAEPPQVARPIRVGKEICIKKSALPSFTGSANFEEIR